MSGDNPEDDVFSDPNFVIDFQQFCNDLLGYQLPMDPYGSSGDVLRFAPRGASPLQGGRVEPRDLCGAAWRQGPWRPRCRLHGHRSRRESWRLPEHRRARSPQPRAAYRIAPPGIEQCYSSASSARVFRRIAARRARESFSSTWRTTSSPVARFPTTLKDVSSLLQTKGFPQREELLMRNQTCASVRCSAASPTFVHQAAIARTWSRASTRRCYAGLSPRASLCGCTSTLA